MKKKAIIVTAVAIAAIIIGFMYFFDVRNAIIMAITTIVAMILAMLDADSKNKCVHVVQAVLHLATIVYVIKILNNYIIAFEVPEKEMLLVFIVTNVLTNIILAVQKSD